MKTLCVLCHKRAAADPDTRLCEKCVLILNFQQANISKPEPLVFSQLEGADQNRRPACELAWGRADIRDDLTTVRNLRSQLLAAEGTPRRCRLGAIGKAVAFVAKLVVWAVAFGLSVASFFLIISSGEFVWDHWVNGGIAFRILTFLPLVAFTLLLVALYYFAYNLMGLSLENAFGGPIKSITESLRRWIASWQDTTRHALVITGMVFLHLLWASSMVWAWRAGATLWGQGPFFWLHAVIVWCIPISCVLHALYRAWHFGTAHCGLRKPQRHRKHFYQAAADRKREMAREKWKA